VTAYRLTPVGAEGVEPHRARIIRFHSFDDLMRENERLKRRVERETALRIRAQARATQAARVLSELERVSPSTAAAVERARREIWRLDE
jgi:hypothetical protein